MLMVILCATFAAAIFDVRVEPVTDQIFPGETAIYDIYTSNPEEQADELFMDFSEDPSWSVITKPAYHQTSYTLEPGEEKRTTIMLMPDETVDPGQVFNYGFNILSKKDSFSRFIELEVFLRNPDRLRDYVPIIETDVDINTEVDPREQAIMTINLKNFNPLNISDLTIDIESTVDSENDKTIVTQLGPLEEKSIEVVISYDDLQPPAKDTFTVTASVPSRNKTFDSKEKTTTILGYNEIIKDSRVEEQFLKTINMVSYYNDGNQPAQESYRIKTSAFRQLFTSSEPEPEVIKDGGYRYLEWTFDLDAQESENVMIVMNYRPLFIIFLVLLVALVLYYVFRSPILIRKEAVRLTKGDDASKIKVLLHVKNRTGSIIENVTVMDKVPRIAVLSTDFPVGTMQPSKIINHEKKGTVLKWNVPTLEAYEERIITYHLGSKLKIIGSLRLPATVVKFKNKMNRFSKVYSSKVTTD